MLDTKSLPNLDTLPSQHNATVHGTFIPPWFVRNVPTCNDLVIVSIIWGISLGLSIFGIIRAGNQTYHQWKRTRKVTTYMVLIWVELVASTIIGGIGWGYVYQTIPPSFEFFFFLLVLWVLQIHCIMQIIINRIALLAVSPKIVRRLTWGVFVFLILINISVFCIWIPSRLQISTRWRHINNVWDRVEKGLFALVDLGLNLYFVYLVRSSLINYGLKKYVVLYRFNLFIVTISMGMDVLIIAMMSLTNTFLYVLFHPLAYLVKLHIEMWMAELIVKIVKSTGPDLSCHCACHNFHARHQSIEVPRHSPDKHPNVLAPTTGRFRKSWPSWPGRAHMRCGSDDINDDSIALHQRSRKAPRTEGREPRRFSWSQRCSTKDCEMGLSSKSSSNGRSSRSNDHQE